MRRTAAPLLKKISRNAGGEQYVQKADIARCRQFKRQRL
jgi:hypothetical protein